MDLPPVNTQQAKWNIKVYFMDPEDQIKKWRIFTKSLTHDFVIQMVNDYWDTKDIEDWNQMQPVTHTPTFELTSKFIIIVKINGIVAT